MWSRVDVAVDCRRSSTVVSWHRMLASGKNASTSSFLVSAPDTTLRPELTDDVGTRFGFEYCLRLSTPRYREEVRVPAREATMPRQGRVTPHASQMPASRSTSWETMHLPSHDALGKKVRLLSVLWMLVCLTPIHP